MEKEARTVHTAHLGNKYAQGQRGPNDPRGARREFPEQDVEEDETKAVTYPQSSLARFRITSHQLVW